MSEELSNLDAIAQAELVRAGKASPLELVDAAIGRIEKTNSALNAVILPLFESARERARIVSRAFSMVWNGADCVPGFESLPFGET